MNFVTSTKIFLIVSICSICVFPVFGCMKEEYYFILRCFWFNGYPPKTGNLSYIAMVQDDPDQVSIWSGISVFGLGTSMFGWDKCVWSGTSVFGLGHYTFGLGTLRILSWDMCIWSGKLYIWSGTSMFVPGQVCFVWDISILFRSLFQTHHQISSYHLCSW
jgi:hypothetical protein